jgi:hemoglobin-like flavoprotein
MFPKQMDEQYKKLVDMLTAIIVRLENLDALTVEIAEMAKRHHTYGVKKVHYQMVGNALLWTLEKGMGNDWNEATRDAWSQCYTELANTMIAAAEEN